MKKIILVVLVVMMSLSCSLGYDVYSEVQDEIFKIKINKSDIFYHDDFLELETVSDISDYLAEHVTYKMDEWNGYLDYWQTPQETFERGFGDCEDFVILFINIYYVVFGEKCDLVGIDNSREVVEGGIATHAIIQLPSGLYYNARNGYIWEGCTPKYIYDFNLLFTF